MHTNITDILCIHYIYGPKMYATCAEWRILHNKELGDIHKSPSSVVNDQKREVAGSSIYIYIYIYELQIVETDNVHRILFRKLFQIHIFEYGKREEKRIS